MPVGRLTAQQGQHAVWQRVGLGQHGGTCLLQNLAARQVGSFRSEVGVLDPAAGSRQVFRGRLQVRHNSAEAVLVRAQCSFRRVDRGQGGVDGAEGSLCTRSRADVDRADRVGRGGVGSFLAFISVQAGKLVVLATNHDTVGVAAVQGHAAGGGANGQTGCIDHTSGGGAIGQHDVAAVGSGQGDGAGQRISRCGDAGLAADLVDRCSRIRALALCGTAVGDGAHVDTVDLERACGVTTGGRSWQCCCGGRGASTGRASQARVGQQGCWQVAALGGNGDVFAIGRGQLDFAGIVDRSGNAGLARYLVDGFSHIGALRNCSARTTGDSSSAVSWGDVGGTQVDGADRNTVDREAVGSDGSGGAGRNGAGDADGASGGGVGRGGHTGLAGDGVDCLGQSVARRSGLASLAAGGSGADLSAVQGQVTSSQGGGGQTAGQRRRTRQAGSERGGLQVGDLVDLDAVVGGGVGAHLERLTGEGAVQQVQAVEAGRFGDAVDFVLELADFRLDRGTVLVRVRTVGRLHSQVTHTLQQIRCRVQAAFSGLSQRDAVVGVTGCDVVAVDLRGHAASDRHTCCVVFGAVDTQAGRQTLQRGGQAGLGSGQVTLCVERGNVGIDIRCHGNSPELVMRGGRRASFYLGVLPCFEAITPWLNLVTETATDSLEQNSTIKSSFHSSASLLACA